MTGRRLGSYISALFAAVFLFGLGLAPAPAQQETKLDGIVYPFAEDCQGGKECNLFFELRGNDAKLVYERMTAKPQEDLCTEGFYKEDKSSGLYCYKGGGDLGYGCYFGYNVDSAKFTKGRFSC